MSKDDKPLLEFEEAAENPCDRCGNLSHSIGSLYFPASKARVYLCDICYYGLLLSFKLDFERMIKRNDS